MNDEIPTFPITGWDIRGLPEIGALVFTPSYLAHSMQALPDALADKHFLMTHQQAEELAQALLRMSQKLKNAEPTGTPTGQPGH